jgi:hypothetical protein
MVQAATVHRRQTIGRYSIRGTPSIGVSSPPDFGRSDDPDHPYGIAYNVVDGSYPKQTVDFSYADESDPGPYPVGRTPTSSRAAIVTPW